MSEQDDSDNISNIDRARWLRQRGKTWDHITKKLGVTEIDLARVALDQKLAPQLNSRQFSEDRITKVWPVVAVIFIAAATLIGIYAVRAGL